MKGGRKDNFYFCLLEHFESENRWFLRSILQVRDEENIEGDDALREWISNYNIREMVVDFPLSSPPCINCTLECPGSNKCPVPAVATIRQKTEKLLQEDQDRLEKNPKQYEYDRNNDDLFFHGKDYVSKSPTHHLLSRSFKRRLKRGLIPYWNRPIDFIIWSNYYDALLKLFNQSYDSFGNTGLVIISRFSYLKRHFPKNLAFYEGHTLIILIEMMRAGMIKQAEIKDLTDIELGRTARQTVIKALEKKLNLFIYENDLDLLVRHPRAFESFLMAASGICLRSTQVRKIPQWIGPESGYFVIPKFVN